MCTVAEIQRPCVPQPHPHPFPNRVSAAATANARLNTLTDLVLSCSTCGREGLRRAANSDNFIWLPRFIHIIIISLSLRGGQSEQTVAPTRFPSTVIVCQLMETRLVAKMYDQLAAGSNAWWSSKAYQTRNSNSISISIFLPSCIIHARARCRGWSSTVEPAEW